MPLPAALALSGLNEEFSDELSNIFQSGAVLLQSPRLTSAGSGPPTSRGTPTMIRTENQEQIPPFEPTASQARNLLMYIDYLLLISNNTELASVNPGNAYAPLQELKYRAPTPKNAKETKKTLSIIYENRNILNVGKNIRKNWPAFTPAEVGTGPLYFFKNRSQYTRVLNIEFHHPVRICPFEDCLFQEGI